MLNPTIKELDRAAAQALAQGDLDRALQLSLELERREPGEANWARRTALVLHRQDRRTEEAAALARAARSFAAKNDVVRALAVCRSILEIDPQHAGARSLVQNLRGGRDPVTAGALRPKIVPGVRVPPPGSQTSLDQVAWRKAIGRSKQVRGTTDHGVHQITLDEGSGTFDIPNMDAGTEVAPPASEPQAPVDVERAIRSVEEELQNIKTTQQALQDTKLFRSLEGAALEALLDRVHTLHLEAHQTVLRQGDAGHELYVIVEGEVGVIDEGPPRRPVARLAAGNFFGEGALVTDERRSATVMTLEPTELIRIDRDTMWALLEAQPSLWPSLLTLFRDRAVERILFKSPLFTVLSANDCKSVRPYFRLIEVDPETDALRQDEMADALSFIIAGKFDVVRDGQALGRLGPGDLFGETSLLCRAPSAVSVRSTGRSYLVEFPGKAFLRIVEHRPRAMQFIEKLIADRRQALDRIRTHRTVSTADLVL